MTRIVVFAKSPVAGRVKTRLIPALGAEGAARLAAEMLERTLEEALATGLDVELCGDPDPSGWYRQTHGCQTPISGGDGKSVSDTDFPRAIALAPQGDGDLGERLARAAFRAGEGVILIGTDCPALNRDRLSAAAGSLQRHDAVIHPADDGGYVLLGLRRAEPSVFEGMAWSTPAVARQTIARIEALGWSLDVRETLRDVDEPADLRHFRASGNPVAAAVAGFPLSRE